ncbi:hypothetical protein CGLO_16988 [Colletotrichum gloeosporioides Cg-14]|uniref:Uncharacterized protein n=2 Tax=Colletotrichum gloeosporioides species complex TaxID=2707338 RepID=T0L7I0_COLGC|nr:hypothetical protein CGLO_16988 [Colletotrichum gloeosporioides Cg-14]KAF0327052.1 hypothetical protein GQ607_005816 [Colletotrichum asianum]
MQFLKIVFTFAAALAVPASAATCIQLGACAEGNDIRQCTSGSCHQKLGQTCTISGNTVSCPN